LITYYYILDSKLFLGMGKCDALHYLAKQSVLN